MNEKDLKILSQNLKKIKTLVGSLDKKVILKSEKNLDYLQEGLYFIIKI